MNLAKISSLKDKTSKYRSETSELQAKSNKLDKDIESQAAYAQFSDPNNDSAIAVNQELVLKLIQKVDLKKKINQYRSQANNYESEVNNLKQPLKFKPLKPLR